jgi:hypothetical protein
MYLAHRKIKGRSVKHYFGSLGLPRMIEEERRAELTQKLRDKIITSAEEAELARGHLRYIVNIASRYAHAFPNKIDEMVSEGARAIVWVLRHPEKLYDNNISAVIAFKTHNFISKFIMGDHLFGPSCALQEQRIANGESPGVLKSHSFETDNGRKKQRSQTHPIVHLNGHGMINFTPQIEIDEIKDRIALTEEDVLILEMREHLYNDREISEKIGKSNSYVHKARTEMQKRYQRLVG